MGNRQSPCLDVRPLTERPIEPVETAVAAFLGRAGRGPLEPTRIRSFSEFVAQFGTGAAHGMLAHAVDGFFGNGGTTAYIVRVGANAPDERPLRAVDYADALHRLAQIADVTIVCAPDVWADVDLGGDPGVAHDVQRALVSHCEQLGDRVAVLDAPPGLDARQALVWRVSTVAFDSRFAALYYPWLKVFDDAVGTARLVPPCGHIAGVWARTDATRGVHKAATNELVRGVIGVGCAISKAEHDMLDPVGVNCVRAFLGRGVRVWGSRTLSSDPQWQDVSVRRVISHIEASIRRGTRWLAEHPDDEQTRRQLVRAVRTFLFQTLLTGALVGESVAEAFRVELVGDGDGDGDGEPGGLVCEIGVAARTPGQFTTFRLVRRCDDGPRITE